MSVVHVKNTNLLASEDITVVTAQLSSSKQIIGMHYDSFYGPKIGCQFTSQSTGAVRLPGGEDNFGWYQTVNPVHRCVSSDDSTTQWWLGVRHH